MARSLVHPFDRVEPRIARGSGQGCWVWTGFVNSNGYGVVDNMTRQIPGPGHLLAHRVVYEKYRGKIPAGLTLDHLCRERSCVNPWHLEAVTLAENKRRGYSPASINARKTHCVRGHELVGDNIYLPPKRPSMRYCRTCRDARNKARSRRGEIA